MRFTLYACLVVVGALVASQAIAKGPTVPTFLSVDINGRNSDSPNPTETGFEPWEMATGLLLDPAIDWGNSGAAGLTKVFATSEGNITANLRGFAPGSNLDARNRGVPDPDYPLRAVLQDFPFAQNNTSPPEDPNVGPAGGGFGQSYLRLELTGLVPNQRYQFTGLAREQAFTAPDQEFNRPTGSAQAWSTLEKLAGVDGPGPYLNANVGMNAVYQGIYEGMDDDMDPMTPDVLVDTGYKNPVPITARYSISGGNHATIPYYYSVTFGASADASGKIVVYTWADANTYNGSNIQRATLLNGFQIGYVPEPASLVLLGMGVFGIAGLRRRSC